MDKEKEIYLWEFSRNLICSPKPVKVIKECAKTYWLDKISPKVTKVHYDNCSGLVGLTRYCFYYLSEENAKYAYEKLKTEEKNRTLYSSREYIRQQAVKEFAEILKSKMRVQGYGIDLKGAIFYDKDIDNLVEEFLK